MLLASVVNPILRNPQFLGRLGHTGETADDLSVPAEFEHPGFVSGTAAGVLWTVVSLGLGFLLRGSFFLFKRPGLGCYQSVLHLPDGLLLAVAAHGHQLHGADAIFLRAFLDVVSKVVV